MTEAWGEPVKISAMSKLSGGAIQENWSVDLERAGGGSPKVVLRKDAPSAVAASHSREHEYRLLEAAFAAGVTVPKPLGICDDLSVIGAPFFLCAHAGGTANARQLVRHEAVADWGPSLAVQLGAELAKVHAITPPRADLAFLGAPPQNAALERVKTYRAYLDEMDAAEPVLEWALRWLERFAPPPLGPVLCHMDFRMGNLMVDQGALTAILDWEFAAWGDPREDLGWFCAKCWRFGATQRAAGGIADRGDFLKGYNDVSGQAVQPEDLSYFEVLATVRWAVIALQQGHRFHRGGEASLELPLTGRMVSELSHDLLAYLAPEGGPHA